MVQGTADIEDNNPLKQNVSIEIRPQKRPVVNRRHIRRRSFSEWWSILPFPYKIFIILITLSVVLVFGLYLKKILAAADLNVPVKLKFIPNPEVPLPPSRSTLHLFKGGAVCSDSSECSQIGREILARNGTVADSALATLFCNGILTMQSMGIGGGFVMNIYIHAEKKAYTLNAKESSPTAATGDMFKTRNDSVTGPLTIGTPGELKGYWELHQRFGSLPWNELVEPAIKLCEEGFIVTKHMADNLHPHLANDYHLRNAFYNNLTKQFYKEGELALPPQQLCSTLKRIAMLGGEDFYTGELAKDIAADLKDAGSIVTKEDLKSYKTQWSDSISVPIYDNNVFVTPPPTNGLLVAYVLNILKGYNFTADSISTLDKEALTLHRFTEALKFAFGKRTLFGDPRFVNVDELIRELSSPKYAESIRQKIDDTKTFENEDHYGAQFFNKTEYGTSHVSILAPNGDAISVTTSINFYFGAGISGKRTGIIFNSGMNDFAVPHLSNYFLIPPSENNLMQPGKQAVTSMSPTIITDQNGDVRLVIGSAGGTKIVSGISSVILRTLYFKQNIKQAIDAPRLHHQVAPMVLEYEYGNTQPLVDELAAFSHKMVRFDHRGAVVCAISKNATGVYANADYRKAGDVNGL